MIQACLSIPFAQTAAMWALAQQALRQFPNLLVELRLDRLVDFNPSHLPKLLRTLTAKRCVVTLKRRLSLTDQTAYRQCWQHAQQAQVYAIDLDYQDQSIWPTSWQLNASKLILSRHTQQPQSLSTLQRWYRQAIQDGATWVKIAIPASSYRQSLAMLHLLQAHRHCIGIVQGELGVWSRLHAHASGSPPLTYVCWPRASSTAPGQIDVESWYNDYAWLPRSDNVLGIVGYPLGHSWSLRWHNLACRHHRLKLRYLPFAMPQWEPFFWTHFAQKLGVVGLSITQPHKQRAAQLASLQGEAAQGCLSVNTLLQTSSGWLGYNVDVPAAQRCIEKLIGPAPWPQRKVVVLGSGGLAHSLAWLLRRHQARLGIYARHPHKAQALVKLHGGSVVHAAQIKTADLVINATCVGQINCPDQMMLSPNDLPQHRAVFDTVYNPAQTPLLQAARQRGNTTLGGIAMFWRQAAMQWRLFTQTPAPLQQWQQMVQTDENFSP